MTIGIDLGSRRAKFALLDGERIVRLEACDTIPFYKRHGRIEGEDLILDLEGSGMFSSAELASSPI
ncbi:MAG TPA: 2-hydroxyglutaryl-CoA dehydratase, partial [Verrucomicrobiae bacterium]|nr:2-hydroxyglutaryl-CoA dehydratase [Verrucomicrobiae bacterium]